MSFLHLVERLRKFGDYYTTPFYMFGDKVESLINFTHPPLISFFNLVILFVYPAITEPALHLIYYSIAIATVIYAYRLAHRFCQYPLFLGLCLLFSPPFYILFQGFMTDAALCCFLLISFVHFIDAIDQGNKRSLYLAIVFYALALGTAFQAVVFLAGYFIYAVLNGKPKHFFMMGWSFIPIALWVLYPLVALGLTPDPVEGVALGDLGQRNKYLYFICQFSLAYVIPVGLLLSILKKSDGGTVLWSLVAGAIGFLLLGKGIFEAYTWTQIIVLGVSASATFCFFFILIVKIAGWFSFNGSLSKERKDDAFIFSLVFIFFPICVVFTGFGANRYLLPIMPFVFIILLRLANPLKMRMATLTLVLSAALSIPVAQADFNFSAVVKKFSQAIHIFVPKDRRIWFVGEWEMRHYMNAVGFNYLTRDSKVEEGDLIVEPSVISRLYVKTLPIPKRLHTEINFHSGSDWRTLNFGTHAGFWGQHWGLLPFWRGTDLLEKFNIYEVITPERRRQLNLGNPAIPITKLDTLQTRVIDMQTRTTHVGDDQTPFEFNVALDGTYLLEMNLALQIPDDWEEIPVPGRFQVWVVDGDEEQMVHEQILPPRTPHFVHWYPVTVNLGGFQGKDVMVRLKTSGVNGRIERGPEALWSRLNLVRVYHVNFDSDPNTKHLLKGLRIL